MAKEGVSPEEGGLRLGVMGGGCSGLSYHIDSIRSRASATAFTTSTACASSSIPNRFFYLHGMTLDYEETLMRQGFNFINPNSSRPAAAVRLSRRLVERGACK